MNCTATFQSAAGLALSLALAAACASPPAPTATATATLPPTATLAPTDTPTPTATIPPTATPRPTATFTPSPTPTPDWPAALSEDFHVRADNWLTGRDSGEVGTWNMTIAGGLYTWQVSALQNMYQYAGPADMDAVRDFALSVTADQTSGATGNSYGLLFRRSGNGTGYIFAITEDGYFCVGRQEGADYTKLIDWTPAASIRSVQPNQLTVLGQGSHFVFYINDHLVGQVDDDRWPTGTAAVIVSLYEAGDEGAFTFDDFEVRAPAKGVAAATPTGGAQAAAQATAQSQSLYERVQQLADTGALTSAEGDYYRLPDFDQSLAQLNYYQPYPTGYSPANFVVRADAAWESASRTADWWHAGCGFIFRSEGVDNEYVSYLGFDGLVYMFRYLDGQFASLGSSYYGKLDVPAGQAQLMLAVQRSHITFFVNDVLVLSRQDASLRSGTLAYTVLSGTNKDFGTRCHMTDVELWELK